MHFAMFVNNVFSFPRIPKLGVSQKLYSEAWHTLFRFMYQVKKPAHLEMGHLERLLTVYHF